MKRISFVVVVLFLSCFTSLAQKSMIEYGIKLGPNFSTWVGEDSEPFDDEQKQMKVGFHGGVFAIIPFAGMFSFQPELLFSTGGVVYKGDGWKDTYSTTSLNIPLA